MASHHDGLSAEAMDATPLVPPAIAFAEAAVSKKPVLTILRKRKEIPLLRESLEEPPITPVPQLVPWFERLSHVFEVFGEMNVCIQVNTSKAPETDLDPGDCECALRFVAIRTALEVAYRLENGADNSVKLEILLPPNVDVWRCYCWRHGFIGQIDICDAPRVFYDWLRGVQDLWITGRFFPLSAHRRLEIERQLRALRTRLSESIGTSE